MVFNETLILLLIPLGIIQLGLSIGMLISIAKKPLPWSDKWVWLLLIFIATIGPIIYFAIGSSKLDEQWAKHQDNHQ